jgi:argininosuccinate lyase
MKLWQKENTLSDSDMNGINAFTAGKDKEFDILLAEVDVKGSLAHARMLLEIKLLTSSEYKLIEEGLHRILDEIKSGSFRIEEDAEDVHSQVELLLTSRIGEAGKKLHSGRSRNDQVLTDIKLFIREKIKLLAGEVNTLFKTLQQLSEQHQSKLLPGYTHGQIAMPSSFGLWFGAYAEGLVDDLELLYAAFRVANKNPLGSGAGFGSSFPLDRELTTALLGFESMNYNVVYAQMSRGKTEKVCAMGMAGIASTLSKLSVDICLYMGQDLGFLSFPDHLTTGSSIMPHKKNPDVFELIRARCNRIQALPNELTLMLANLPSGYHRDFQLTKECLFPAFDALSSCLRMSDYMLKHIQVKDHILDDPKYKFIWSVEAVNKEVLRGVPFREAYKKVGKAISNGDFTFTQVPNHTHAGSIGNLCTKEIKEQMEKVMIGFIDQSEVRKAKSEI